jgi:hypothetical protein
MIAATGRALAVSQSPNAHQPARGNTMNLELLIPISLFVCITYAIKAVVDAGVRRKMVDSSGSQDLVRAMLQTEEQRSRHGSLRWGVILVALAIGFGIVDAGHWDELTPAVIAILLGATGLGNLAYYAIARKQGG